MTTPVANTVRHRVLVIDGGGRGHAICRLFTRTDPDVTVFYGPGCDLVQDDRIVSVPSISLFNPRTALEFLLENPVDFVFVAHIDALSRAYVDILRASGQRVIGPDRAAALLEASKERGKRFCADNGIPMPRYQAFTDPELAREYVRSLPYECVVKTDGLTLLGDGTVVCDSPAEAEAAVVQFASEAGDDFRVVIEERLRGWEISVFALLDGDSALALPSALDYKRTFEDDRGKNCDGMGSVTPHPEAGPELDAEIRRTVLDPVVRAMRHEGLDYSGFLYIAVMMTDDGPRVIEINTRIGDSEAQVLLPGIRTDFTSLCRAVLDRTLHEQKIHTDGLARCCVALTQGCLDPDDPDAHPGYPFAGFITGQHVTGLEAVDADEADLFYADLRADALGRPVTAGGRVVHVVGAGSTLAEARERAYRQIDRIAFRGMRYRGDIGLLVENEGALR
ncbi:phosphoribosylamine--glycine ligase [Catellatospora sichuanensis]|uniref:phosphoribosylamine--glycine ligase n=1 Tax=Catellatospora sichuanensis TaxID=1969805 RepID=UPI001183DB8F|nr:phosphoribosylamine--glycine ligase [Catellatospora sichuanensis]